MIDPFLWPAWAAGAAIGTYAFLQRWVTNEPLGCSSAFGNVCARMGSGLPMFQEKSFHRANDWRIWFVIGIFLGGLLSNLHGDWSTHEQLGPFYEALLPAGTFERVLWWLGGGVMVGAGARMAGGCTSGHTIAGVAIGAPSSIVASTLFFVGAVGTAQIAWLLLGHGW